MKDWSVPLLPRGQREGAEKGQLAAQQDASANRNRGYRRTGYFSDSL